MSNPGFFLYTGDWIKDTRCLTATARGCWADALCFLNEHKGSVTWPITAFANSWSVSPEVAWEVLEELKVTEVANVELSTGVGESKQTQANASKAQAKLTCRRMVRRFEEDEQISEVRSEAGRKGGQNTQAKVKQIKQPSSSSSISSSHNLLRAAKAKRSDSERKPLSPEQIERNKKLFHEFAEGIGRSQ